MRLTERSIPMKWALTAILIFAAGCATNQPSSQAEPRVTRVKLTPKLLSYAEDHVRDVIGEQLPAAPSAVIYAPNEVLACELTGGAYGKHVRRELFAAGMVDAPNMAGDIIRQKYVVTWVIANGQPKGGSLCVPVMGPSSVQTVSLEQVNAFNGAQQQPEPHPRSRRQADRVVAR